MKAVVDTNVIAHYVLGTTEFVKEAGSFWRVAREVVAPASWEIELANAVWMAVRMKVMTAAEGSRRLDLASSLGVRSVPVRQLWHGALARAVRSGVPAYDTVFVELAEREEVPLGTFDKQVLRTFPTTAQRPTVFASG